MRNMISELRRPASRAQFVSFSNVSTQGVIRARAWGVEACGVPFAYGGV